MENSINLQYRGQVELRIGDDVKRLNAVSSVVAGGVLDKVAVSGSRGLGTGQVRGEFLAVLPGISGHSSRVSRSPSILH